MTPEQPTPDRELPDEDADRLTYEAMRRDGRFVPQSPDEVAKAEAEIDETAVELPPGLRDPLALLDRAPQAPSVEPSSVVNSPERTSKQENPMRGTRLRKMIAWTVLVGTVATLLGTQLVPWQLAARDARNTERTLQAKRDVLTGVAAEQAAAKQVSRKPVDDALAAEAELARRFWTEYEAAQKAIADKEFVVRLTGPEHIQPGAPNKWQIETLRHGAIARPKQLDIVVKDAKDTELLRHTHHNPVGVATLELTPAFWQNVKPGTELFLNVVAHTDARASVLAERLPLGRPVFVTHLVTDKPLYKPGEVIRFRSLTLDRSSLRPPEHDLHLRFKLRDPGDAVVTLDEGNGRLLRDLQPVLGPDGKPLRGIGVGEHPLSAEAPGGEYKLDLFEVSGDKETLLETRKFIVNRYVPDTFEKKLEFDGKSYGPGEFVQARIEVSRTAGGPMRNAQANVVAAANGKTFHEQKNAAFRTITDAAGTKTVLDVRFQLPASIFEGNSPSATLSVNILDGSDAEAIVRPIPLVTKTLKVEFFPEGGEMIDGVTGRVYFMVKLPTGKPADLKGTITDGTNTIAEVATLTDAENPGVNRGHGIFKLKPEAGKRYFLKIASPLGITEPTKDGFPLPAAKADGVALTALDAVTPKGGAVRVRVQSPAAKTLHVGAYVRERLITQQKVVVAANESRELSLQGDEAAGGVTRVTVFEERKDDAGRTVLVPRAERLVFRGSGEFLSLTATPDKSRYSPSDKVRLDLSAVTEKGQPTPAVLLVGVVNRSVITMADNKTDRLQSTHFLLSGEVKNSAELEHADFLLTDHPRAGEAIDLLLGTQGWRRFAEQDIAPANPADKPDVDKMLLAHGQRTSASLELFKLESQRVRAEFAPKLELARLRVAAAEIAWNAVPPALLDKLTEARVNVSVAESQHSEGSQAVRRYESRFEKAGYALLVVVLIVPVLVALFLLIRAGLAGTADKPAGRARPYIAATGAVIVCGLGVVLLFTSKAKYAPNETSLRISKAHLESTDRLDTTATPVGDVFLELAPSNAVVLASGGESTIAASDPKRAPKSDAQKLRDAVKKLNDAMATKSRFDLYREAKTSEVQSERSKLTGAFRSRGNLRSMSEREFDRSRGWGQSLAVENSIVMSDEARKPWPGPFIEDVGQLSNAIDIPPAVRVTPFVVREYAHQRDPELGEVRADFTETVFWHPVLVLPQNGKATVEFQLSDDIARYQVLVAGHTLDGRIGATTHTIEARKPFSVDPKLPLEISHTDTIDMPLRVTNDSDARRNVNLNTTLAGFKTAGSLQDTIGLSPNGKSRKMLRLTADKLDGNASLLIEGASGADKDAIARTIRVVPDGFPGVGSVSDTMEGRARGVVNLPKDVVPGSLRVRLEVYPTSMADLVKGLDGLLREPSGCFEQTSTSNYPNTMILDYMNQTNQANPETAKRAKDFLARGYSRLTGFECPDTPTKARQGYEWFGAADRPHLALTAYGLLQFKDMSRVHAVDPQMIKRTQAFLMSRRDGLGGFRQPPDAHSFGNAPKQTVDAYVVWALVESDPEDTEKLDLRTEIAALKAEALNENSTGGKDPYFVALTANVLLMRGEREAAHRLLDRLQEKHTKGGAVTGAATSITRSGGRDLEIETTALALLGWLRANDPKYGTTVKEATKWISQQRGGYGGFGSTQSTILALKSLTLFAKKAAHPAEAGEVRVSLGGKEIGSRHFTKDDVEVIGLDIANPEAVFKFGERNEVEIVTDAKQAYPFALSYTYTTLTPLSAEKCAVKIGTRLGKAEAAEGDTVPLHVTFENKLNKGHGMAVAIIGIPAGMKVPTDMKQLTDLREKGTISYFETRGRELVLYWRSLAPNQKIELSVDLVCDVPGVYRGPASRGYLYYDADHKHWVEPLAVKIAPMA